MSIYTKKLKYVSLDIGGNEFRALCTSWKLVNGTEEGEQQFTFGVDGQNEDREEAEPSWTLELKFFADWRTPTGISHWLWTNKGTTVPFEIGHHVGDTGSDPSWTGEVNIKAPDTGGDVRTTEITEITLTVNGEPDYVAAI